MIRWSYLVPRLVVVTTLWAALYFGVDPLLRRSVSTIGAQALGGRVDIRQARMSWIDPGLRLTEIEVANPRSPMRNLFQAAEISVQLDRGALLQKKWVLRDGRIRGLQLGTPRKDSGAASRWDLSDLFSNTDLSDADFAPGGFQAESMQRWLNNAQALLAGELEQQLQSVRLVKEMLRRWPEEFNALEQRATDLHQRVVKLQEFAKTVSEDPLRHVHELEAAARDMELVRGEIKQMPQEFQRLRGQIEQDWRRLAEAKNADLRWLEETLTLEQLRAEGLSQFLLGRETDQQVKQVFQWVQWLRRRLRPQIEEAEVMRGRGEDIWFASLPSSPHWLVERLTIEGQTQWNGVPLEIAGQLQGLTDQPAVYGRPTVIALQTSGAAQITMHAVLDRTGAVPHDRIVIDVPAAPQPGATLGDAEKLAVTISPGNMHVWCSLDVKANEIDGRLLIKQAPVEITPHFGFSNTGFAKSGERLTANAGESLRAIDALRVQVTLSGTVEAPKWRLESDLGGKLAAVVQETMSREIEFRRRQIEERMDRFLAKQTAEMDQWLAARQRELANRLNVDERQIDQIQQLLAGKFNLPGDLGKTQLRTALPAGQEIQQKLQGFLRR